MLDTNIKELLSIKLIRNYSRFILLIHAFILVNSLNIQNHSCIEEVLKEQKIDYFIIYGKNSHSILIKNQNINLNITLKNVFISDCIEFVNIETINLNIYLENVNIKLFDVCKNRFISNNIFHSAIQHITNIKSMKISNVTLINVVTDSQLLNLDLKQCDDCKVQQVSLINLSSEKSLFSFQFALNLKAEDFQSDFRSIYQSNLPIIDIIDPQSKEIYLKNFEFPSQRLIQQEKQLQKENKFIQDQDKTNSSILKENAKFKNYEQQQRTLISINQVNQQCKFYLENIKTDFNGYNIRSLTLYHDNDNRYDSNIIISNSVFLRNKAITDGGSIYIQGVNSLYLNNTLFNSSSSGRFAGAVMAFFIDYDNTTFQNCQSKMGGAIYYSNSKTSFNFTNFINNTAFIQDPDIFSNYGLEHWFLFYFEQIFEYNPQLRGTPLNFVEKKKGIQNDGYSSYELIYGVYYIIKFRIGDLKSFSQQQSIGNLYDLLSPQYKQYYFQMSIQNITYPYLVTTYSPYFDCNNQIGLKNPFSERQMIFELQFLAFHNGLSSWENCFNVTYECKQGMVNQEDIYQQSRLQSCSRCEIGTVSYDPQQKCQVCNNQLYDLCYSNISSLKSGYWRSNLTIDDSYIYECSINPSNCNGDNRESVGDYMCSNGYIGEQCLKCDDKGVFWNDSYGQSGSFQCVQCSSLQYNFLFFISSMCFQMLLLMFTLYTNFVRMKNQVLRKYLSKLRLVYIGTSFLRQSQTSVYIKILLFNFQMYLTAYYFVDFNKSDSSTIHGSFYTFINPAQSSGNKSYDCFLSEIFPNYENIGYLKLQIAVFLPLIANCIIFVFAIIIIFFKKLRKISLLYVMVHCFSYTILFVFQSQILQYTIESLRCLQLTQENAFLLLDTSIKCSDKQWMSKLGALNITSIVFYIILVPFGLFISLFIQRKNLDKSKVICFLGFLYDEYKRQFYYWQFLKVLMTIAMTSLLQIFRTQIILAVLMYCALLTVYGMSVVRFLPFQSITLNKIEIYSIVLSILYLLSSLSLQLLYTSKQKQDAYSSNRFIANFFYYSVIVLLALFYIYMTILIIKSFFYTSIQKLQNHRLFECVSKIFPSIHSKLYTKQLRSNFRILREKVKEINWLRSQSGDSNYSNLQFISNNENEASHLSSFDDRQQEKIQ